MALDRMYAPWRNDYVGSYAPTPGQDRCVFCKAVADGVQDGGLVVHLTPLSLVVMNLFPYNSGHVMVSPRRHVGRLTDATSDELSEMVGLAQKLEGVLGEVYKPHGMNIGMNLGSAAGAGFAEHIHLHVVPRWNGDANFMTTVAETRVVPEDPGKACARLRPFFTT
jgi:ATP adenylyltransferase